MIEGWAAVAVGAATVAGAAIASSGAQSAAQTQADASNNAQQISQQEFNTITSQENPYLQSGYGAESQLNYLLGIGAPGQGMGGSTASGAPPGAVSTPGGMAGYDPSSGYHLGAGGSIGQLIPGGSAGGTAPASTSPGGAVGPYGVAPGAPISGNPYPVGSPGYALYNGGVSINGGTGGVGVGVSTGTQGMPASGYAYNGPSTASSSTAGGYGSLLSPFTADTFKQYSPAYQFQLQQGEQGTLNADASSEGALSGAAQKDLIGYNQGLANTSFNNAFNQYQTQQGNIYSRLAGIANLGQSAASNTAQSGTALAGQAAQSAQNAGSAIAAGKVGSANAWSGAASSLAGLYGAGANTDTNVWFNGGQGTASLVEP